MERRKKKPFETAYLEATLFPEADVISTSGIETLPDWFGETGNQEVGTSDGYSS